MNIDFSFVIPYLPILFKAAGLTIVITVLSQAIGTVLGFFFALARMSNIPILRGVVWTYVLIFRGTPMLLHLFYVYYAAPAVGITLEPFTAAIVAMSLSTTAYNCEILRAGLQAVPRGQIEAAQAVGMTWPRILRTIVIPQALRVIIVPYMTNFISHTKGSSLASVITVPELMLTAQMIYSSTYRAIEILTAAGAIYLILTSALTLAQLWLERWLRYDERGLSRRRRRQLLLPAGGNG